MQLHETLLILAEALVPVLLALLAKNTEITRKNLDELKGIKQKIDFSQDSWKREITDIVLTNNSNIEKLITLCSKNTNK